MSTIITESERNYLISSMEELLDEYDYNYTTRALNKIIDEWAQEKSTLIEAFKKHPNYLEGKFMIAFDRDYERTIDCLASYNFQMYIKYTVASSSLMNDVPTEIKERRIADHCSYLPDDLWNFFRRLEDIAARTISSETADKINDMVPEIHAHKGEKTSRVINRLCTYLGYNKHPDYNREFAKYADSLSPLSIKRHTVLSLNPLDYLTMSFGNSWASCHTIDKTNKRGMPNTYSGQYSSGTISYMLDPSSMVFYTVDASYDGNDYWTQPKINRQMFHWGEEKLVQGRLYPQDNDGNNEAYTPYRQIVQKIMSEIFNFPNLWTVKKGTSAASAYIISYGTNYKDYNCYDNCTLSIKKNENENVKTFVVGAAPICIECGERHDNSETINCCSQKNCCVDCGCALDEDDIIWINDEPYCRDCVSYCECCEEYHRQEEYYIEGRNIYVCESCFESYYATCYCCGCNVDRDDVTWVESENEYVCDECLADHYFQCEHCGEWFNNEEHPHADECICENCHNEEDEAC